MKHQSGVLLAYHEDQTRVHNILSFVQQFDRKCFSQGAVALGLHCQEGWVLALVASLLLTSASARQQPDSKIKNACAFNITTIADLDQKPNVDAIKNAILQVINNATSDDLIVSTKGTHVLAAFSGDNANKSAEELCSSLPVSLVERLPADIFGKIAVSDITLSTLAPTARSCYVYGYNLSRCGYGNPMPGCSEIRKCFRYKRGRCVDSRRVCCCGGTLFGGCGGC